MKKIKNKSNGGRKVWRKEHVNKLVAKPLGRKVKKHTVECLKQGAEILEKLEEIDKTIGIIAAEMKRQVDKIGKPS